MTRVLPLSLIVRYKHSWRGKLDSVDFIALMNPSDVVDNPTGLFVAVA